jgi:hypothetical protein
VSDHPTEPALEDIEREFPAWHAWTGVSGLLYARLPRSSPPVVVRGQDAAELREAIRRWEREHQ